MSEVRFETFRGILDSWDHLLTEAAKFASKLPAGSLITISHSADGGEGVVVVWYRK